MNATLAPQRAPESLPVPPPATARRRESAWTLLRRAAGGPRALAGKFLRLIVGLWRYLDTRVLDARLRRLQEQGHIEAIPSRVQLFVGSLDMVRFWIAPAADDYYRSLGINYHFHQLLRFLDEPLSLTDPLGFQSSRDAIIGHLMQVVHANPLYDLQLLDAHPGGLDALEEQLEQMLAGTHPRAASIGAIVEEPDYHERLLVHVRAWRRDPSAPPLLRSNVGEDTSWSVLEATFGSLTEAMRYFRRLPTGFCAGLRHLVRVRAFPRELGAEPARPAGLPFGGGRV